LNSYRFTFINSILLCLALWLPFQNICAGIIEMPVIVEPPALHGKSVFENFNIPSTVNRSLDPSAGPRLWIKEIRIQGLENFPELGIRRDEVTAFIEVRRYNIMREDEVKEHGFTEKEVTEVMKLLNQLDVETNYEHVSEPELQRFIWLVREQKERRGLTLGQIEGLASDVQNYYRSHGLKLAVAYIPRQFMREGVLVIEVLNGKLGGVVVEGNQRYSTNILTDPFDDILAQPVTFDRIEERMFLINDYPGISTQGIFQPGEQIGDSKLALKVTHENAFDSTLRLDNHGSELTGKYRAFIEFYWNNPSGIADQLNIAFLQSTSPDNSTYGLIGYNLPLFSPRWHLSLSASTNQFILDQTQSNNSSQLGIIGTTEQQNINLSYTFKRSRELNVWFRLINDTTKTILDSDEFGNLGLDDKIQSNRISTQFDVLDNESKILHLGSVTATSGSFLEGAGARDEDYSKFNADYTLMTFVPLSWFNTTTRLLLKTDLQFSDNALPSAEQSAIASPTKLRAYPVNQFSTDSSLYLGLEWVFNTPEFIKFDWFKVRNLHQKIQPLFFIDAASGIQVSINGAEDTKGTLSDIGFGIQYGFGRHISGNLQFAFPLSDDFNTTAITVPDDNFRIVFDFQYRI